MAGPMKGAGKMPSPPAKGSKPLGGSTHPQGSLKKAGTRIATGTGK